MSTDIDPTNREALHFIRTMADTVREISVPLQELCITSFSYGRFFEDGKRLYLSNNLEWIEIYFKEELYNNSEQSKFYVPPLNMRYCLWSDIEKDIDFKFNYHNKSPFKNGFSIYDLQNGYLDYFGFGGQLNENQIKNYFINHIKDFENFITIFKESISKAIDSKDKSRLITPKSLFSFNKIRRPSFIEKDKIESFKQQIGLILH